MTLYSRAEVPGAPPNHPGLGNSTAGTPQIGQSCLGSQEDTGPLAFPKSLRRPGEGKGRAGAGRRSPRCTSGGRPSRTAGA